jgi:SAM-dependent MidA family methyltransferase
LLENIIIEKIKKEGPIPFHDFMDMCLYYPRLGYYTSPGNKTGRNGDYFTSPEFTFLFGELLARQIEEMWFVMGKPHFTIVEYGAGNGLLAHDILYFLKSNKSFYRQLHYCIIEKNTHSLSELPEQFPGKISIHESIHELNSFKGCVLANELIDNFPVHLVEMHDELMEVFVNYNDGFTEELQPADEELKIYLADQGIKLPKGYRTEINLETRKWLNEIARTMDQGYVLTIDYGYPSNEYYQPERYKGTLVCFHQHKINQDPYINIGKQDITAHVDFSGLLRNGEECSFQFGAFTDQVSFLQCLGLNNKIREIESLNATGNPGIMRMIQTFLFDMGKKFKVMLLQKNVPERVLSGFQFCYQLKNKKSQLNETFIAPMESEPR